MHGKNSFWGFYWYKHHNGKAKHVNLIMTYLANPDNTHFRKSK